MTVRTVPRRPGALALAWLLCGAALGGCVPMGELSALEHRIEDAGYVDVSAEREALPGAATLWLEASTPPPTGSWTTADVDTISEIVWDTYPGDVDRLELYLNGEQAESLSGSQLLAMHGPRPQRFPDPPRSPTRLVAALAVLAGFVLLLGGIFGVLALVLRQQRRRPPPGYWGAS